MYMKSWHPTGCYASYTVRYEKLEKNKLSYSTCTIYSSNEFNAYIQYFHFNTII